MTVEASELRRKAGECTPPQLPPLLHTPEAAAERLQCGRSLIYELMRSGEIESVKVGRLRRIPESALVDYVERLRLANAS